ncbi:hypothetical protein Tco_0918713, partial [Tanacetum coccineum]
NAYTSYSNPIGFFYQNKDKKNKLMRIDELHKFSDGTLDDVRTALNDRLKGIRMEYLQRQYRDRVMRTDSTVAKPCQGEWDAWEEETIIDEDEVIPEDETPELIIEFQIVDKRVPTMFDHARMEATLNDMLSNHFKNAEEVTELVKITTDQPHGLDFMEQIIVMRENDKPTSFSKDDFKYLNKNDIEDLSRVIWERVHDFQLGIEIYQVKVNLTAPILRFPGIEAHEQCSIIDKPTTDLIYLNNKDEKRVMYLMEIVKFVMLRWKRF